ncbi:MAG: GNAT family N-acetyltransferase [Rhodothermia bacterium]|nr:GNAT family N-acetyltransferase [Rhodothermia bacterium]
MNEAYPTKCQKNLKLIPFVAEVHLGVLKKWVLSHEDLILFGGPSVFTYPLSDEEWGVFLDVASEKRSSFMVADDREGAFLGFAQIREMSPTTKRLCRLLVGQSKMRGQGIGKQLVQALLEHCFQDPNLALVELNVYTHNARAIRCYSRCGFTNAPETSPNPTDTLNWQAIRMVRSREMLV